MNFEKLNIEIFEGKAGRKVLFQPRIECWYYDKVFLGQKLPGSCGAEEQGIFNKGVQHNVHNLRLQKDRGARQADTGALS